MMRVRIETGVWTVVAAFVLSGVALGAKSSTLTGKVSDAMCGAKHSMPGNDAECTRGCVKKGSDYALVVKNKVYTLKTSAADAKDQLDKLAGMTAKVTGDVSGDTIQVASVEAAK